MSANYEFDSGNNQFGSSFISLQNPAKFLGEYYKSIEDADLRKRMIGKDGNRVPKRVILKGLNGTHKIFQLL